MSDVAEAPEKTKRPSMRKAINDHCKQCIYDPLSGLGNWRQQTEGCPATTCSLWPLRPISKPRKEEALDVEESEERAE